MSDRLKCFRVYCEGYLGMRLELTTNSTLSGYGQYVAVDHQTGRTYGPGDLPLGASLILEFAEDADALRAWAHPIGAGYDHRTEGPEVDCYMLLGAGEPAPRGLRLTDVVS
jgi:hypothetical protein